LNRGGGKASGVKRVGRTTDRIQVFDLVEGCVKLAARSRTQQKLFAPPLISARYGEHSFF
jgi:hypothetical protein